MADSKSTAAVTDSVIKQVNFAASEIAQIAQVIHRNAIQSTEEINSDDSRLLEALVISNQNLALQIGYISDLISEKLNGIPTRGGAERWLMPPAYFYDVDQEVAS